MKATKLFRKIFVPGYSFPRWESCGQACKMFLVDAYAIGIPRFFSQPNWAVAVVLKSKFGTWNGWIYNLGLVASLKMSSLHSCSARKILWFLNTRNTRKSWERKECKTEACRWLSQSPLINYSNGSNFYKNDRTSLGEWTIQYSASAPLKMFENRLTLERVDCAFPLWGHRLDRSKDTAALTDIFSCLPIFKFAELWNYPWNVCASRNKWSSKTFQRRLATERCGRVRLPLVCRNLRPSNSKVYFKGTKEMVRKESIGNGVKSILWNWEPFLFFIIMSEELQEHQR